MLRGSLVDVDASPSMYHWCQAGNTPLHVAVSEGMVEATALLLAHGALPRRRNRENMTTADYGRDALAMMRNDAPNSLSSHHDRARYAEDISRIEECVTLVENDAKASAAALWDFAYAGNRVELHQLLESVRHAK